jgi:hypothetical protein
MSSSANAPATVSVDDVHVHESGTVGSPAVVFVHGGGPGGRMWSAHLERLSDRFHCLAPTSQVSAAAITLLPYRWTRRQTFSPI